MPSAFAQMSRVVIEELAAGRATAEEAKAMLRVNRDIAEGTLPLASEAELSSVEKAPRVSSARFRIM